MWESAGIHLADQIAEENKIMYLTWDNIVTWENFFLSEKLLSFQEALLIKRLEYINDAFVKGWQFTPRQL